VVQEPWEREAISSTAIERQQTAVDSAVDNYGNYVTNDVVDQLHNESLYSVNHSCE